ncbi:MAG: GNAT family N-acetyltransferase [Candidatus Hodarchaeota archaeon]
MEFRKGYIAKIDDRYSIHIAADSEDELKSIVNFSMEVHQEEVLKTYIPNIFLEHPGRNEILWLYIKDDKLNKLISLICLSPIEWQIEDIPLPICEMEFVGTLEEYREKGFVKLLNKLYEKIIDQNGYILSVIRGIPYFYRKLGYEYVSSLDERIAIPASKIPNKKYENLNIRKANSKDLSFIKTKYNQFHKRFYIFNRFEPESFKFKYLNDIFNSEVRSTYIFNELSIPTNYFSVGMSYDNQNYEITTPNLSKNEMISLLQFIKKMGKYKANDVITFSVSEHSPLFDYIKSLGGKPVSTYGWQVKIPNLKKFFHFVKNLIERRLNHSEFKGLTKTIRISNYNETIVLTFNNGKIEKIEIKKEYPNPRTTDLMIPGALLFKLLLGDRTIDEINHIIKDAIVNNTSKSLIETMFPKIISLFSSYI